MNFMLYEVKQRRFTKLNTHFLPYWPLQKKAIDESGGMKWCDLKCCTEIGKDVSLKSTMSI